MDHSEAGRHWNSIKSTWTATARAGHDFYRDRFNTPAFIDLLPRHAAEIPPERGTIQFGIASVVNLPFEDAAFDLAAGFMSFMDIPEMENVLSENPRALKPSGFVQFSILHPCFNTPHRVNLQSSHEITYAIEVGNYFRSLNGEMLEFNLPDTQAAKDGSALMRIPRLTRILR